MKTRAKHRTSRSEKPLKAVSWPSPGRDFKPEAASAKDLPRLAGFYSEHTAGHHQMMYNVLQGCCRIADELGKDRKQFRLLKSHTFFDSFNKKPSDDETEKWVTYFVLGATNTKRRDRACKYAAIIAALRRENIEVDEVASEIKRRGGIEKTYRNIPKQSSVRYDDDNENSSDDSVADQTDQSGEDASNEHGNKVKLSPEKPKTWVTMSEKNLIVAVSRAQMSEALKSEEFVLTGRVSGTDDDEWKNITATRLRIKKKR